jgi:hypothetical protein
MEGHFYSGAGSRLQAYVTLGLFASNGVSTQGINNLYRSGFIHKMALLLQRLHQ